MNNEWLPPNPHGTTGAAPAAATPRAPRRGRWLFLAVGVVVLLVAALVVWFVGDEGGGDSAGHRASTSVIDTSGPATSSPATSSQASTTATAPDSSLVLPTYRPDGGGPATVEQLLAAMPTDDQLPTDWQRYAGPETDPERSGTEGYCGGPNAFQRADASGATASIEGPSWDLPTGAWVGVEIYAFATAADARSFVEGTRDQANSCTSSPRTYSATEAEYDLLPDGFGDSATWSVVEASAASEGQFTAQQGTARVTLEWSYATTVVGTPVTAHQTELVRYEQRGGLVVEVWIEGMWGYTGTPTAPEWAYRPDQGALDAVYGILWPALTGNLNRAADIRL